MPSITISQLENNIAKLPNDCVIDPEWVYRFLKCFDFPRATISRLRIASNSQSNKEHGIISLKNKLYFKIVDSHQLFLELDDLKTLPTVRGKFRFVVALNQSQISVLDTKTGEQKLIEICDIATQHSIFLPLINIESSSILLEHYLDNKAAYKLGKFYEEIKIINEFQTDQQIHALNQFLARILFCLFAEDTNIFPDGSFQHILNLSQNDGSDLNKILTRLFIVLNTPRDQRMNLPEYLSVFDYVNGGLFSDDTTVPIFNLKSREFLIQSAKLDWSAINPDIFGSMVQTVLRNDLNNDNTEHFTSVPNIMRLINPLFLEGLKAEFNDIIAKKVDLFESEVGTRNTQIKINKELDKLRDRICNIKFFDPAVGSANFLIITYKEIRRLEMAIINEMGVLHFSNVRLYNFYGIEINDFSAEIAKLSLWLAEHQMNVEFYNQFGSSNPTLPLRDSANITKGNAAQIDWETVCPKIEGDEIYIIGNPPFGGSTKQEQSQKNDLQKVFTKDYKSLDYVSLWYYLGAKYIRGINAKMALVSTNSICQGEQVSLLWPRVLQADIEINFAYQSFKWQNSARGNAGVTCVIIGLANKCNQKKVIFNGGELNNRHVVNEISCYLSNGKNVYIQKLTAPITPSFKQMEYGNMPLEGGFLKLDNAEKDALILKDSRITKYIRKLAGGFEMINNVNRFCLWIEDNELDEVSKIPCIMERISKVRSFRVHGGEVAKSLSNRSHQFRYRQIPNNSMLAIPCTNSENREYLVCDFYDKNYISINSLQIIYDAEPWIFGIISSRMHMVWVRAVGGRLKTDLRYSSTLIYNTFPFPEISDEYRSKITQCVRRVLERREGYSDKTLAQLYDPAKMPVDLKEAHTSLDIVIDRCYLDNLKQFRGRDYFESDAERLEMLFELYESMNKKI